YRKQHISYTLRDDIESLFYTVMSIFCSGRLIWDKGLTYSEVLQGKYFMVTGAFEDQLKFAAEEHRDILRGLRDLLFEGPDPKEVTIDQVIGFLTVNLERLELMV
ncbi:hypothetical protein BGX27_005675, partial [Mortierella sp. AM989]